jgi:hypothetical protein
MKMNDFQKAVRDANLFDVLNDHVRFHASGSVSVQNHVFFAMGETKENWAEKVVAQLRDRGIAVNCVVTAQAPKPNYNMTVWSALLTCKTGVGEDQPHWDQRGLDEVEPRETYGGDANEIIRDQIAANPDRIQFVRGKRGTCRYCDTVTVGTLCSWWEESQHLEVMSLCPKCRDAGRAGDPSKIEIIGKQDPTAKANIVLNQALDKFFGTQA